MATEKEAETVGNIYDILGMSGWSPGDYTAPGFQVTGGINAMNQARWETYLRGLQELVAAEKATRDVLAATRRAWESRGSWVEDLTEALGYIPIFTIPARISEAAYRDVVESDAAAAARALGVPLSDIEQLANLFGVSAPQNEPRAEPITTETTIRRR